MNDYIELRLDATPCDEIRTDILAALLAQAGFESFVPDETGLTAYIKSELFDREAVDGLLADFPMETDFAVSQKLVEGQDWNKEWEKNYFQPIVIDDQCVIHSSFHKDIPECRYDIVIDPKMAFGTGHHATTSLVIRQLLAMNLQGLNVVDMGTGTGILAILATMRGARRVDAVEIDEFAYTNAVENMRLNSTETVELHLGDAAELEPIKDVNLFIANINRNIITADIAAYAATLAPGATMLLSGFYEEDIPVIMAAAEPLGLTYKSHTVLNRWCCLKLCIF
ncbi:MAG: 50S ribosomal protein L11 methyltransferase [Duncaniella sp.]|uniref:50S ribosomal protein L11 methyltransferase n=1 Tax=Duncaniella sp. TaxID=2518496 RepID=UPI0023CE80AB|nr:50S ribosomal protein L11 methyltransferase [Duncaniella sp.]MDE5988004.1 50S ribosomal protein L11 methyltransferase [Duncaniella sp.]MDE6174396.1 50S ribosomal protein L11 methyltransferase [Duncaniella sp.]